MAENPTASPQNHPNPLPPDPQNPNLASPSQMPSPRMNQFQQQMLLQQQQQQSMIAVASPSDSSNSGGFQMQQKQKQQNLPMMPRMTQMQQQYGTAAAANALRQHTGMYGAQVNFSGASNLQQQQQQQQQQQIGMSRVGMMGQGAGGQIPMLSSQAAAAQFNLQTQMLSQARQKAGLVQGSQYHTVNTSAQALQGMQTIGMSSSLGSNAQLIANGALPYAAQRMAQGQIRQQQLSQAQLSSSPQKLSGQGMTRTSSLASMNSQLPGLTQNGQAAMVQNSLSQQQWLKQTQLAMLGPGSPSYQLHQQRQQAYLQQQMQKSLPLNQQQISQLIQQQPQLTSQQKQQLQTQTLSAQQQPMHLQQQQSPRIPVTIGQKSMTLTGSQPNTPGGSSSQGDTSNQLLGKRKIRDLVSQVDPHVTLDTEIEHLLLELADDFIETVTTFACTLAKHRKSSILESKDVLLHLEQNWHLNIPGYAKDDQRLQKKMLPCEAHTKRMEMIRSLMESSQREKEVMNTKGTFRQVMNVAATDGSVRPLSSEQLISSPPGSSMMQKVPRF